MLDSKHWAIENEKQKLFSQNGFYEKKTLRSLY